MEIVERIYPNLSYYFGSACFRRIVLQKDYRFPNLLFGLADLLTMITSIFVQDSLPDVPSPDNQMSELRIDILKIRY